MSGTIVALAVRMGRSICYTAQPRLYCRGGTRRHPSDASMQHLIITGTRDQARLTRSFDLRPAEHIDFRPGQIAMLRVEGEEPSYFAFASAPDDADLEVLVKQKAGASSVIYDMKAGDEIELVGIAGQGFKL